MSRLRANLFSCLFLLCFITSIHIHAQSTVVVQQEVIPVAYIDDPGLIASIIESNLIPADADSVKKIRFIDITRNGFGDNDLLTLFPSRQTYPFIVDATLANVMQSWHFNTGQQLITTNREPEFFEHLLPTGLQSRILAGILRTVNQNYHNLPIKLYFSRDSTGSVRLDLWGMDTTGAVLNWHPPSIRQSRSTGTDTIYIVQRDTIFVSVKSPEND